MFRTTFVLVALICSSVTFAENQDIYIGGRFAVQGQYSFLAGLLPNGASNSLFQTNFNTTPFPQNDVFKILRQPDGKLLILSRSSSLVWVRRYLADGHLDNSFQEVTFESGSVYATEGSLAIQSNGKILVGGGFSSIDGNYDLNHQSIARLNSNGTLDTSFISPFNTNPIETRVSVTSIEVLSDGSIIVAGWKNPFSHKIFVAKLTSVGQLNLSFQNQLGYLPGHISNLMKDSNGKFWALGNFNSGFYDVGTQTELDLNAHLIRLESNGALDPVSTTNHGPECPYGYHFSSPYNALTIDAQNRAYIATGSSQLCGNSSHPGIVRMNSSMQVDLQFTVSTTSIPNQIKAMKVQSNGSLLAAGFRYTSNQTAPSLVRLLPTGVIDSSLTLSPSVTGTGFSNGYETVFSIELAAPRATTLKTSPVLRMESK